MSKKIITLPGILNSSQITGSSAFQLNTTTAKWSEFTKAMINQQPINYVNNNYVYSILSYTYKNEQNNAWLSYFSKEVGSFVEEKFIKGPNDTILNTKFFIRTNETLWSNLKDAIEKYLEIYYVVKNNEYYQLDSYEINYQDVFNGEYYNESTGDVVQIALEEGTFGEVVQSYDYSLQYFHIKSLQDGNDISLYSESDSETIVEYQVNSTTGTWLELYIDPGAEEHLCTLQNGDKLYLRSKTKRDGRIGTSGNFEARGNIMSLIHGDDFVGKTSLVSYGGFKRYFSGTKCCKANKLVLPATTLETDCYQYMFYGCTMLSSAPDLPATTWAEKCYRSMFQDCTSLTTVPRILPTTTVFSNCCDRMFCNCKSLTTAPELPATNLAEYCYCEMFDDCTSLTTVPDLPATNLADYCYYHMFYNCTSLTAAPDLPATTLATGCYSGMFYNCKNLTTAPELPARTLVAECYSYMFYNCKKLNYIKALWDEQNVNWTSKWVSGVASSGTYIKSSNYVNWTQSVNTIPQGWNILDEDLYIKENTTSWNTLLEAISYNLNLYYVDSNNNSYIINDYVIDNNNVFRGTYNNASNYSVAVDLERGSNGRVIERDYKNDYLTFIVTSGSLYFNVSSTYYGQTRPIDYSLDGGCTWKTTYSYSSAVLVTKGQRILWKSTWSPSYQYDTYGGFTTSGSGTFDVNGNILSIRYGDYSIHYNSGKFVDCFSGLTSLVNAEKLYLPTYLIDNCYADMFYSCTSLKTAPKLPALALASYCYYRMFYNCTSLTTAPELPAQTLMSNCYNQMFYGCSSLNYIKCLATSISASNCTYEWVYRVYSNSGTFVKNSNMYSWGRGVNGIPSNWTIQNS